MNIPVVYEDNWLLILDKPSGLLTIPTPKKESRTLTDILNSDLKNKNLSYRLYPCHRLDRETSGLIIYAKTKSIRQQMMQIFKLKKIKKSYLAFVQGNIPKQSGQINYSIEGKVANSEYKVLERRKDFNIVEVRPLTGRTNQIRMHFKMLGFPVLGEKKFAFRRDFKLKANRLCLHASAIEFMHPVTKENIALTSPLPEAMSNFLNKHL
jgi:23S rRNA pseudouridine1911/1915/1917 synthase